MWWMYLVLGLLAGVVSASFGVGAGIVMVPALVLLPWFGLRQQSAQGVALCVMVPMALVGAWRYVRDPTIEVDLRLAGLIAAGAVVGAYFGQRVASRLPALTLRRAFAVFIFIVAVRMFVASKPRAGSAGADAAADRAGGTVQAGALRQPEKSQGESR